MAIQFATGEKKYPYIFDCRINSVYEMLRYYGKEIDPSYIHLLSEQYDFLFCYADVPKLELEHIPYAVASRADIYESVFTRLGVSFQKEHLDDSKEAEDRIRAILNEDKPILMKADERAGVMGEIFEETLNIRNTSIPIQLGYSEDGNKVRIFWTNNNVKSPITEVDKTQFNTYRGKECLPYSPNFECGYVTDAESLHKMSQNDLMHLLANSITNISSKMLDESRKITDIPDSFTKEQYTGVKGIMKLRDELQTLWWAAVAKPKDEETQAYVTFVLALLKENFIHGSQSAYREEYGKALQKFGEETGDAKLVKCGEKLAGTGKYWKTLIYTTRKLQHGIDGKKKEILMLSYELSKAVREEARIHEEVLWRMWQHTS